MSSIRPFLLFLVLIGVFLFNFTACVKEKRGMLRKQSRAPSRTGKMAGPSGLKPVFPNNARCIEIACPYWSRTRYDGSLRPEYRHGGRHGGIDLSLTEGTPLLGMAGGTVVKKGEGGMMEGIYLFMRHSPEDTGLSYSVFSKYQHLQSLPELPIGAKVVVGQVIARSGKTGTVGGHYGSTGYPHLHLSTKKILNGGTQKTGFDPLMFYHEASLKLKDSVGPSSSAKTVVIPYMTTDGHIWPHGTRVVWPVACQPR